VFTTISFALFVWVPAVTANPFAIGAAFFLSGVGIVVWNVITVSLRQRVTPDRLLGRLNSGYRLIAWGTMPLGAAFGGLLAQLLGLRWVFAISGLLTLSLLVAMTRVTDAAMDAAERAAAREGQRVTEHAAEDSVARSAEQTAGGEAGGEAEPPVTTPSR
jgi:MFS family permease